MECYEDGLHIVVVAWKGKTSVRAYVAKCDRIHYLRLCGADLSKFGKIPVKVVVDEKFNVILYFHYKEVNKFAEKERSAQNDLEEKDENKKEDVSIDEGHKVPVDMDNVEKEIPVDIDNAENQAPVNMDVVVKEDAVAE